MLSKLSKSAIIPLKFNATLDGISGIVIGNLFQIEKEYLPKSYQSDNIAFIVTKEKQKVSNGQDWTTTISGQLVIKDSEKNNAKLFLDNYGLKDPFVTLIPGAKWKQKSWLSKKYNEVIDYIIHHLKYKVVMLGGDNDEICNTISRINQRN